MVMGRQLFWVTPSVAAPGDTDPSDATVCVRVCVRVVEQSVWGRYAGVSTVHCIDLPEQDRNQKFIYFGGVFLPFLLFVFFPFFLFFPTFFPCLEMALKSSWEILGTVAVAPSALAEENDICSHQSRFLGFKYTQCVCGRTLAANALLVFYLDHGMCLMAANVVLLLLNEI